MVAVLLEETRPSFNPCGFSYRRSNPEVDIGVCFASERYAEYTRIQDIYDTVGVAGTLALTIAALVLVVITVAWFRREPRLAQLGSWIQGWHPGQLVIAWVGAAVLLLALLVVLEAEGGEEGMVFSAVSAVLAMLGVTWKWFGGRPR